MKLYSTSNPKSRSPKLWSGLRPATAWLGAISLVWLSACGAGSKDKKDNAQDSAADAAAAPEASATPAPVDPHAGVEKDSGTKTATDAKPAPASTFKCDKEKTPTEFVTTLTQDLFRRGPTSDELKKFGGKDFQATKVVDWAFTQGDYDTGIAYFMSNLLRIEQNLKMDPDLRDQDEIALLSDLKQEPIVLVQRNKDKPWSYFFTTQDIYCTAHTAPLYEFPVDSNISGFVPCKMQAERAGLMGLVSVLRAFPSAFYLTNSNRHRVAISLYLAQGLQLAAKTDGPTGEGRPQPLAACVPEIDNRVSSSGLIFGTAAVPKSGAVCAGCHSKYLAPLEPAFMRFDSDGKIMTLSDIDKLNSNMLQGISRNTLKDIMQYGEKSCWSPDNSDDPPQAYAGLPGMARLMASSKKLGTALAIQIQQNLVNRDVDDAATQSIVDSYNKNGETLQAALRGYFLSEPYLCAKRGN